jgi:hypothetical protein
MPYWIYKRANREYVPIWMYMVDAVLSIFQGTLNLFLVPFGYKCDIVTSWCGYILRHMMDTHKERRIRPD